MIISSTHIFRFNKLFFLFLFKITGCKSPIFHKFLISIVFSIEFFFLEHSTTLLLLDCSSILSLNPKPLPLAAMLRRRRGPLLLAAAAAASAGAVAAALPSGEGRGAAPSVLHAVARSSRAVYTVRPQI